MTPGESQQPRTAAADQDLGRGEIAKLGRLGNLIRRVVVALECGALVGPHGLDDFQRFFEP